MEYSKIKSLADKRNLSIPQIASKIGMSKAGLYVAIEKKRLNVDTIEKIAKALSVPVSYFFGDYDASFLSEKEILALNDLRNDYLFSKAKNKELSKTLYLIEMILSEIKTNDGLTMPEIKKKVGDVLEFAKLSADTLNQLQERNISMNDLSDITKVIDSVIKKSQIKWESFSNDDGETKISVSDKTFVVINNPSDIKEKTRKADS